MSDTDEKKKRMSDLEYQQYKDSLDLLLQRIDENTNDQDQDDLIDEYEKGVDK